MLKFYHVDDSEQYRLRLENDLLWREHLVQSHRDEKAGGLFCLGSESRDVVGQGRSEDFAFLNTFILGVAGNNVVIRRHLLHCIQ